jgi:hypothetical protein
MYRTNAPEVNTIIGQVVTIVQHTLHILPYDFSLARSKLDEWKCRRRSKQTLSRAPPVGPCSLPCGGNHEATERTARARRFTPSRISSGVA